MQLPVTPPIALINGMHLHHLWTSKQMKLWNLRPELLQHEVLLLLLLFASFAQRLWWGDTTYKKTTDGHFPAFMMFFLSTGTSDTKTVLQTPAFIIKRTGESLNNEIECSHSIENYEVIMWYKTSWNETLRFLGFLNLGFPYPEEDLKAKISFEGDGSQKSKLSVSDLQVSDSAVYYCAARRHSAADPMQSMQKPSFIFTDPHLLMPPSAWRPESFYQPFGSPLTLTCKLKITRQKRSGR